MFQCPAATFISAGLIKGNKYNIMLNSFKTATLAVALLLAVSATTYAAGIGTANVKFGKPQNKNSECSGKGICMLSSSAEGMEGGVGTTFVLVEDPTAEMYTLTMQFNISLMSSANHDYLYQYFLYPDGEPRPKFAFDGSYTLRDAALCASLGIEPGAVTIKMDSAPEKNIDKLGDSDIRLTFVIAK